MKSCCDWGHKELLHACHEGFRPEPWPLIRGVDFAVCLFLLARDAAKNSTCLLYKSLVNMQHAPALWICGIHHKDGLLERFQGAHHPRIDLLVHPTLVYGSLSKPFVLIDMACTENVLP